MKLSQLVVIASIPLLLVGVLRYAAFVPSPARFEPPQQLLSDQLSSGVQNVDQAFAEYWGQQNCLPAPRASDLQVLRRLFFALIGSPPSLEEIRQFESDTAPQRLDRWTAQLLEDTRFAYYFADRLARCLTGVEQGQLIVFRRDRLRDWLARQLLDDTPWPVMVRSLIAADGLWTDNPAVNYITVARTDEEIIDTNKLAARTARVFLGQRMDCAQCHDHPFDERWKQRDFEGLAAYFDGVGLAFTGVTDDDQQVKTSASVPFDPHWCSQTGTRRQQLAEWLVHPDNVRFERAIANRIWGLMTGRPLVTPVDDLPHPDQPVPQPLVTLGKEFRRHGSSLRNLIRVISSSKAFQISSESDAPPEQVLHLAEHQALFPLTRLRPEQVVGAIFQSSLIATADQDSHPLIRFRRLIAETEFIREFGDAGEDELSEQGVTVSQTLLRMNGKLTTESTSTEMLNGPGQLVSFCPDNESLIRNAFLMCLTRQPDTRELDLFLRQYQLPSQESDTADDLQKQHRTEATEDLFWALMNSPEFIWNH